MHCLYHSACAGCYAIKMFEEIIKKRTKVAGGKRTYIQLHNYKCAHTHTHTSAYVCKWSECLLVCVLVAGSSHLFAYGCVAPQLLYFTAIRTYHKHTYIYISIYFTILLYGFVSNFMILFSFLFQQLSYFLLYFALLRTIPQLDNSSVWCYVCSLQVYGCVGEWLRQLLLPMLVVRLKVRYNKNGNMLTGICLCLSL